MKISSVNIVLIGITAIFLFIIRGQTVEHKNASTDEMFLKITDDSAGVPHESGIQWLQFVRASERLISENEIRITAYKETIEEAGPKAMVLYRKKVEQLEQQNIDLRIKLETMKKTERSNRDEFKLIFNRELNRLTKKIDETIPRNG
ncbi:MAG: hypothetical protein WCW40_12340 [Bacteroidota bacterium]